MNGIQGMTRASLITDLPQRRQVEGRKRQGLPRKNPTCVRGGGIMDEASEVIRKQTSSTSNTTIK